jgi:hypothetical protein
MRENGKISDHFPHVEKMVDLNIKISIADLAKRHI